MPDDVLLNTVAIIERRIAPVEQQYRGRESELVTNLTRQDTIILNLQRICEAAIDLAIHLVFLSAGMWRCKTCPRLLLKYSQMRPGTVLKTGKAAMLLEQLREQRDLINAACRQYGARRIRVFGSVARGEEQPGSDIDFLVELPHGYDLFKQRMPLQERLAEITGRQLDVIPEHELNRHIRASVLQEAVEL